MKQFKCRCSKIGDIVPVTKKDLDAGVLGKGAQTYVKKWLKEQPEHYGRRKEFYGKYTYKGHAVEDDSIEFAGMYLGYDFLFKNEEYYSNDWVHGTPDVVLPDTILDVKNSWDYDTFPYWENKIPSTNYWWQGQGYMWLTGRKHYKLVYTLLDAPDEQVLSEAKRICFSNYLDLDTHLDEMYEKKKEELTYSDLPEHKRIKVFEFDRDEEAIERIQERVEAARRYVEELTENRKTIIKV